MGLGDYFRPPSSPRELESHRPRSRSMVQPRQTRKQPGESKRSGSFPAKGLGGQDLNLDAIRSSRASRAQSLSGHSTRSATSSFFIDIKHEVMVNYLYQQQCARLWVSNGNSGVEGVIVRKSRTQYLACPPQLAYTPFAQAIASLGVQVSHVKSTDTSSPSDEGNRARFIVCFD